MTGWLVVVGGTMVFAIVVSLIVLGFAFMANRRPWPAAWSMLSAGFLICLTYIGWAMSTRWWV